MNEREKILVHPVVWDEFVAQFEPPITASQQNGLRNLFSSLYGIPVYKSEQALCFSPPKDPFIEYEASDYDWLERLGYGKRVPGVVVMNAG